MESRDLASVSRPIFSSHGLECLRSRLGLLVSRLYMNYFFYEVLQEGAP